MSLIQEVHESLPYLDTEPTPDERAAAEALIKASTGSTKAPHSSLPPLAAANLTPALEEAMSQFASGKTKLEPTGIDLSRYNDPTSIEGTDQQKLEAAYIANAHLSNRIANLSLLDAYGRNAWLVGNDNLEKILGGIERELAQVKEATEQVNRSRREAQEGVRGEMEGLEKDWRRAVGRILETEIAAEQLRLRILEAKRSG